jgi:hypothetical protein
MLDARSSLCRSGLLTSTLLLSALAGTTSANQSSAQTSPRSVDESVTSSLPALHGQRADIVEHLDLTRPFDTQGHWTFVAILPGSHSDGVILAHKSGRMTTHYSAAELGNLVAAVNRIANSHGSHTGTVLRWVA